MSNRNPDFPFASTPFQGGRDVWIADGAGVATKPHDGGVEVTIWTDSDGEYTSFVVPSDIVGEVVDMLTLHQPDGTDWFAWAEHYITDIVPDLVA